ncbi:F-box protein At1g67340-like [Nymphaea colorata]|nr:F-box protein At1g67340-like [Nymphaea colorata]
MRTRRGMCYPRVRLVEEKRGEEKRKRAVWHQDIRRKRRRTEPDGEKRDNFFDQLPDDLVLCILSKLSSRALSPADFVNVLLTCKRLNGLGLNPAVLAKASAGVLSIRAPKWSESAHAFLKRCADAGNVEACFTLGMIRFYCLENRGSGASLMAKAAIASHSPALYSLAVIQFNGSGGTKNDKDLRAGVALCARAASLGHIDALREFGHCLQDGYGVRQNVAEGRRFLVQANARELACVLSAYCSGSGATLPQHHHHHDQSHHPSSPSRFRYDPTRFRPWLASLIESRWQSAGCPLLSDFGCNVPPPESHPANRFLVEWFAIRPPEGGLRLCSHASCGKPETRKHEFRRCSVCGNVNYCSRACQALDWKIRHKHECLPLGRWHDGEDEEDGGDEDDEDDGDVEEEDEEEEDDELDRRNDDFNGDSGSMQTDGAITR